MERIYTIRLDNGATYQARGDVALELAVNDRCVIRKDFYFDLGTVTRVGVELEPGKGAEMPSIQRKAEAADLTAAEDNVRRAAGAMRTAHDMISHLSLDMKLLNALFSMDGKLLTIQFTAEGRVDFRELVKELSRAVNARIELRQIGVRDESAIHGGISVCGQVLCCCRFLHEFNSINVRMAKDQDLSLTPATISGVCGRLKCCLKFEHEGYLELEKTMPRRGEWCECPGGRGRVCDRNLLTQEVTVQLEGGNTMRCPCSEIKVTPQERPPKQQNRKPDGRGGERRENGERREGGERRDRGDRKQDNRNGERNGNDRNDRRNRDRDRRKNDGGARPEGQQPNQNQNSNQNQNPNPNPPANEPVNGNGGNE